MSAPDARREGLEDAVGGDWIDVTRELGPDHPTWPGDTAIVMRQTASIADGDRVNVMALGFSTHTGTHVDAPYHYDADGGPLASIPLADLMGPCVVLDVRGPEGTSGPVESAALLAALDRVAHGSSRAAPRRVLIKTGQRDAWTEFPEDFRSVTPELIGEAARRGVDLLGTDAPSVDALGSADLPSHAACAAHGVRIVEGLALADVAEGHYEMICLPLRLRDADGSPVRALLRPLER